MKLHPRLTPQGVVLVKRASPLRRLAEPRPGGGWVIGYGHTASAREGALVSEADADALLVYDLSRSAERVESLLRSPVDAGRFDALNAVAFRMGADAFARSDVLRRINAGEAPTPEEILAAREPAGPAVLAAAEAVRVRLEQVLRLDPADDEAAHPRLFPPPEPKPESEPEPESEPALVLPPETVREPELAFEEPADPEPPPFVAAPPPAPSPADLQREPPADDLETTPYLPAYTAAGGAEGLVAPPQAEPVVAPTPAPAAVEPGEADLEATRLPTPFDRPDGSHWAPPADPARPVPAPIITFERGGRSSLWRRIKDDPRTYAAVGACGAALFVSALVGFALGRPTGLGLAIGLTGILCLTVSAAFFLYRWMGGHMPRP